MYRKEKYVYDTDLYMYMRPYIYYNIEYQYIYKVYVYKSTLIIFLIYTTADFYAERYRNSFQFRSGT